MKKISFILLFFLTSLDVFAMSINDLEKIMINNNIKGNFQQEKIIMGFPNPIISTGNFIIKNKELYWITEKPRKSTIKINPYGIFSLSTNNQWFKIQSQYDKSIFLDIVDMDFNKIGSMFDINIIGDNMNWKIVLKPKSNIIGKIFNNIFIHGGKYILKIEIVEENGDITIMQFTEVSQTEN